MNVTDAVAARRSVRGFIDRPVAPELLREIVVKAARAPSGGNLQPWHIDVVTGDSLSRIVAAVGARLARGEAETPAYAIYPPELDMPYRDRRFGIGEAMYREIGIPREDRAARRSWFARNFRFFDAPAALFSTVERLMVPPHWSARGMYLQSAMLLSVVAGLATCPQECCAMFPETVTRELGTPPERMLFCGMAIGYEDVEEAANRLRSARAPEEEWLTMHD